jgi:hypothetical protein
MKVEIKKKNLKRIFIKIFPEVSRFRNLMMHWITGVAQELKQRQKSVAL